MAIFVAALRPVRYPCQTRLLASISARTSSRPISLRRHEIGALAPVLGQVLAHGVDVNRLANHAGDVVGEPQLNRLQFNTRRFRVKSSPSERLWKAGTTGF
jgi:hypothetical protein